MPVPDYDPDTGSLPPGIHSATWDEIVNAFGFSSRRQELLGGLRRALDALGEAGCGRVYLNGSFVTDKEEPNDFDGCWSAHGVDPARLDPTLLDWDNQRASQKAKYGGELFVAEAIEGVHGRRFLEFFQNDKDGRAKGIIMIDLAVET